MRIEWDAVKATRNRRKHGVSFEEAKTVLRHSLGITVDDVTHSEAEDREKTIGLSARGRVLVVVHTKRSEDVIRIVHARKADRREVFDYEQEIRQRLQED
ncbi:MAG: BrnT family toxin [Tepidisphaeraceae bacterium]